MRPTAGVAGRNRGNYVSRVGFCPSDASGAQELSRDDRVDRAGATTEPGGESAEDQREAAQRAPRDTVLAAVSAVSAAFCFTSAVLSRYCFS